MILTEPLGKIEEERAIYEIWEFIYLIFILVYIIYIIQSNLPKIANFSPD